MKCFISDFYCVECGSKGISIPRKEGQEREPGHLKKLLCLKCQKVTNHAEVRENTWTYTKENFEEEFYLGRFINGQRAPINELCGCSKIDCYYNINGKCWNANNSFDCKHRPKEV